MPTQTSEVPALREMLAKCGRRHTKQREAVFAYLRETKAHPTADQVHEAVRKQIPNIGLATVYKCLEALVSAGLASKIADSSGPARFDCRHEEHYHLRCTRTGKVCDLETPYDPTLPIKLDPEMLKRLEDQGFQITGHRLELIGYFKQDGINQSS